MRLCDKTTRAIAAFAVALIVGSQANMPGQRRGGPTMAPRIKHVVIIVQENVSFDHYFATYPRAENPPGEPVFRPRPDTPSVNGLNAALLAANPNSFQPFRLTSAQSTP